jgi:hypothetical protein
LSCEQHEGKRALPENADCSVQHPSAALRQGQAARHLRRRALEEQADAERLLAAAQEDPDACNTGHTVVPGIGTEAAARLPKECD